jgi:hypothetical protein
MIPELKFFLQSIGQWLDGLDPFEQGLLIYFVILLILWVWKGNESSDEKGDDGNGATKEKYSLAVNKKDFIREVVSWGIRNISYDGVSKKRNSVELEISYHPHKKLHGVFFSNQKKIRVYVNNHARVKDIVDTSLHEVVHLLQYTADKRNFQKKYNKLLQEKTYAKHPMEIEAVKLAAYYTDHCINYLIEQGKLINR